MAEFWKLLAFILVPVILIALGMIFFGFGSPDVRPIVPRHMRYESPAEPPQDRWLIASPRIQP